MSERVVITPNTNTANSLPINDQGDALITISHAHQELHKGNFYNASEVATGGLPASGKKYWLIESLTPKMVHLALSVATAQASIVVRVYENPTATAGTPVIVTNANRNDIEAPQAIITKDPTVTLVGTELGLSTLIPSGSTGGGNASGSIGGGPVRGNTELILAENTEYLLEIENLSNSVDTISINIGYYLHPEV